MNLWIKICGNTSLEDALVAAEAGADALGFVFAASTRRVTAEQVAAIVPGLPSSVEKIGVFIESSFEEIETAVSAGLTGVQLHSEETENLPARLRERFGANLRILHVLHFGPETAGKASILAYDKSIDCILVDSRTATAVGGTGIAFDWQAARRIFRASQMPMVVAGGLTPANVAEAIRTLKPWGVDVVSGVEARPGRKDAEKVREFVRNARGSEPIAANGSF